MLFKRDKKTLASEHLQGDNTTPGVQADVASFIRRLMDVIAGYVEVGAYKNAPVVNLYTDGDIAYFHEQIEAALKDLETAPASSVHNAKAKIDAMIELMVPAISGKPEKLPARELPKAKPASDEDVAAIIKKLKDETTKIETEIHDVRSRRNAEIAQKDAEIAALNREIEQTTAHIQRQNDEINRRAEKRAELLATVAKIDANLDAAKILNDADIRREVVRRKFGDGAVQDRSEAYVDERFDSLAARANVDPFAKALADGIRPAPTAKDAADQAYLDMVKDLTSAHTKH
jgi:hypothetical protein